MGFFSGPTQAQYDQDRDAAIEDARAPLGFEASDLGKAAVGTMARINAGAAEGVRFGASMAGNKRLARNAAIDAELSRRQAGEYDASMSPGAQRLAKATFLPDDQGKAEVWDAPGSAIALKTAQMAPYFVASAIPAALLTTVAGGSALVGAGGAGLVNAALGTGDVLSSISEGIDNYSDAELMEQSQVYRHERDNGVDELDAKNNLKDIAADEQVVLTALLNFATGFLGPESMVATRLGGAAAKDTIKTAVAKGLGSGFGTEAAEGGQAEASRQESLNEIGLGPDIDWKKVVKQAVEEGVFGALIEGPAGAVSSVGNTRKPAKITPVGPDVAQAAALTGGGGQPVSSGPVESPPTLVVKPEAQPGNELPPRSQPITGEKTPPPGAKIEKTPRRYKKPKAEGGVAPPVQAVDTVAPDAAQAAAMGTQQAPVGGRKRAQEYLAQQEVAPVAQVPPPVVEQPPIPVAPEPVVQPPPIETLQAPLEQPPGPTVQDIEAQPLPPSTDLPEILPPEPAPRRVLPDIATQQAMEAEVAARNELPRKYEPRGKEIAEFGSWRRRMSIEAQQESASEIAREAASIVGKRGTKLNDQQKVRLKELHEQWKGLQAPVEPQIAPEELAKQETAGNEFVMALARDVVGSKTPIRERLIDVVDMLSSARQVPGLVKAIQSNPYTKAVVSLLQKIDGGVATDQDVQAFEQFEQEFTKPTMAELERETRDIEAGSLGGTEVSEVREEVESDPNAGALITSNRLDEKPEPSAVRRPALSDEEKKALVEKFENKEKSEKAPLPSVEAQGETREEAEPAGDEAPREELPRNVTPEPKPKKGPKKKTKSQRDEDHLNDIGRHLLAWRRNARDIERTEGVDAPGLANLKNSISEAEERIKRVFGDEAHGRTMKQLEAMLRSDEQRAAPSRAAVEDQKYRTGRKGTRTVKSGDGLEGELLSSDTVGDALKDTSIVKELVDKFSQAASRYVGATQEISARSLQMMAERLKILAGDTPVYVVKQEDFEKFTAGMKWTPRAYYDTRTKAIYFSEQAFNEESSANLLHVLMHEAAHAAFENTISSNRRLQSNLLQLMDIAEKQLPPHVQRQLFIDYAFTNEHEFVSEVWSNPIVQRYLAEIEVPADLARKLGLPSFAKHSVWSSFVNLVRKALGFGKDFYSVLDGVIATTTNSTISRIPADEAHYWGNAMGDLDKIIHPAPPGPTQFMQNDLKARIKQNMPAAKARKALLNVLTLNQIAQLGAKYFPDGMAMRVSDLVGKMRVRRQELVSNAQSKVVTPLHKLQMKYKGDVWNRFTQLAHDATTADIHPDLPLTHKKNAHVKKGVKWDNSRAEHARLSPLYQALPEDLKAAWHDVARHLTDQQNTISLLQLNNIVEAVLGRRDEQLAQRLHSGQLTAADKSLFRTNAAMRAISKAVELKKINGVYFPKTRRGDYVVTGTYKIPSKYKSNLVKGTDDRYVFDTRKEAKAFADDMRARGVHISNSQSYSVDATSGDKYYTYTDPATGAVVLDSTGQPKRFRFSKGDIGAKQVVEVTVQNKLVEFHETEKSARVAEADYRKDANYKINGVELKDTINYGASRVSSRNLRRVTKTMEQSSRYKAMSASEKKLTQQALMEMSLNFLNGTAPQNRTRVRRNVLGASTDMTRNVADYVNASSGARANLELGPELGEALDALDKHREDFQHQATDMTLPRSQIADAMRAQIEDKRDEAPTTSNRVINFLLRWSFLDKLASPAYHLINMQQPWMVTGPVLAGRHGLGRAAVALTRAYQSAGMKDILLSGARDTKTAFTDMLEGTTDYMADIRKRLASESDGKQLSEMLDYLHERGLIDKDSGFEIAELIGRPNRAEHFLSRADHVVRQFGTAVETLNRVTSAIAAYRLESERGASHQEAMAYAQQVVNDTQGDYSHTNAPKVFKHPMARILLQFKKFAQLQYYLLGKNVYNAFKGATRQERIQAGKTLAGLMVAHAAMAGALGLPTEPIKLTLMLLSAIGLPVPGWDDIEREATAFAKEYLGDNLGDAVVHGLPRLVNIDLHSRVGLNSLLLFGEPRKQEEAYVKSWMWELVGGPVPALGADVVTGANSLMNGDFADAAEKLIPLKIVADAIKGTRIATEGKKNKRGESTTEPTGFLAFEPYIQALGFKPATVARRQEDRAAFFAESGNRKEARQELLDAFGNAGTASERGAVRAQIRAYNKTVPKDAQINEGTLERLKKRKASDRKKGYVQQGMYGGKQNKDLLEKYIGE